MAGKREILKRNNYCNLKPILTKMTLYKRLLLAVAAQKCLKVSFHKV